MENKPKKEVPEHIVQEIAPILIKAAKRALADKNRKVLTNKTA